VGRQVEVVNVVAEVIREREDARPRVDRQLKREAPLRLTGAWLHAHLHDALPDRAAVAITRDVTDGVEHGTIAGRGFAVRGSRVRVPGKNDASAQLSNAISIG